MEQDKSLMEKKQPTISIKKSRCPYCHDEVEKGVRPEICPGCHALHHKECWDEHNHKCSSCGFSPAEAILAKNSPNDLIDCIDPKCTKLIRRKDFENHLDTHDKNFIERHVARRSKKRTAEENIIAVAIFLSTAAIAGALAIGFIYLLKYIAIADIASVVSHVLLCTIFMIVIVGFLPRVP